MEMKTMSPFRDIKAPYAFNGGTGTTANIELESIDPKGDKEEASSAWYILFFPNSSDARKCCRRSTPPREWGRRRLWPLRRILTVVAVTFAFFFLAYRIILGCLTRFAIHNFIDVVDDEHLYDHPDEGYVRSIEHNWWPGCGEVNSSSELYTNCGGDCFSPKFARSMISFARLNPAGRLISYPSRGKDGVEMVTLRGWWLPPIQETIEGFGPAPRVVVQHGFHGHSNAFRQVVAAYILRLLGFGVLINNFRDHGYSGSSIRHTVEWGGSYVYDLLGAWDYIRNDPEGILGGPREADQVAIFGISMGAFVAAEALGVESKVPGVWLDSPPFTPAAIFFHGAKKTMRNMGLSLLCPLMIDSVWKSVKEEALRRGVNLETDLPEALLAKGPDTHRPVYIVTNHQDDIVPISDPTAMMDIFKTMPEKYDLRGFWVNNDICEDSEHAADSLSKFNEYTSRACRHFRSIFGMSIEECDAGTKKFV